MFTTKQLWAVAAMCWQHYIHPYPLLATVDVVCPCHMQRKRGIHDEVFWEQTNTSTKWNTAASISQTLNIFGGFRGYHTFARREIQAHRSDQLTLFCLGFAYFLRLTLRNWPIKTYM